MNHFEQVMKAILETKFASVDPHFKSSDIGLFGNKIRYDFLIADYAGKELVIEAKYQRVTGTTDQKIVFAVEQIKQCHSVDTILIICGPGWGKGAKTWAAAQVGGRLMDVMLLEDFIVWLERL